MTLSSDLLIHADQRQPVFAFGGFEQPNYVLGEISRPRRKYPVGIITGVCIAVVLYMAVNVSYMAVVPRERQINENVAQVFFELTLGSISPGSEHSKTGYRIFNALLAVSSFGNIVVMTYTAARVKQEIAKEGILPFPKFFAQNSDFSLGRLLKFLRRKGIGRSVLRWRWLSPSHHSEKTPVGALLLHLGFCVVLIFATYDLTPDSAYGLLTGVSAYAINAFFGFWLGLGILRLRIFGPPTAPTTNNTATSAANGATAAVVNGLAGNQSVAGVDAASAAAAADNNDKPHILSTMQSRQPPRPTWRQLTGGPRRGFHPWLSVLAASVYTVGNLYPLVASWVPPSTRQTALGVSEYLPWWEVPTVALCVLTAGGLWWVGWILVARYRERTRGLVFVVRRRPEFESAAEDRRQDDEEDGHVPGSSRRSQRDEGLVLVHETIFLHWVGKETLVDGSGVAAASGAVASPIPSGVDGASRRRGTVPAAPAPAAPVGRGHDGGVELVEWDHTRFTDR